jgi:alpha-glucoside transport system substrate-binding protein
MRIRQIAAPFVVATLLLAACGGDDDDDAADNDNTEDSGGGGGDNTGTVNVLNAMEPEEADAIQPIIDEQYGDADYQVEIEASGEFEDQFPIRAEGGTLDVALLPQPGAVRDQAEAGTIVSMEDLGFDIDELNDLFGEYFVGLTEVDGEHYGLPTNINLKSMIWYPKDDFDAAGYEVPETWTTSSPSATRSSTTAARPGASASRAKPRRAGRRRTGWRTSCSALRAPMSTTSGSTTTSRSTTMP